MHSYTITTVKDIEKIEAELPLEDLVTVDSTYDLIRKSAEAHSDRTAISFFLSGNDYRESHEFTYDDLLGHITATANFFHSIADTEEVVVAILLPNIPETQFVMWGAETACRLFAVNSLLEPEQIAELLNGAGATTIVTLNPMPIFDLWEKVVSILPGLEHVRHLVGIDIAQYAPRHQAQMARELQRQGRETIDLAGDVRYHNFHDAIERHRRDALSFKRIFDDNTIASMFCTGGTTGLPKIACRTHRNEIANAISLQAMAPDLMTPSSVILGGLPLFHVNGAMLTGLLPLMAGAQLVMATPQGYRGEGVLPNAWDIVEHYGISMMSAVPTVYSVLLGVPIGERDVSSLELAICGSAPLPSETHRQFESVTGVRILEGYGLTEATCVSCCNIANAEPRIGSIGVPLPFQDVICAELDETQRITRECGTDEPGTILIKGPTVFQGYSDTRHNQSLWATDDQGNNWLNTGDLGRRDADGYLWLTGRKKELIVRGGHNIEPKVIEEALCLHPDIAMAAAVGKPDAHAGEIPVCYVSLNKASAPSESELLQFAKSNIHERAAVPKRIHIVDELPLTAVGKVFKPDLEKTEIRNCIVEIAGEIHAGDGIQVSVVQDPIKGRVAVVDLERWPTEAVRTLTERLGSFTFKFEIAE